MFPYRHVKFRNGWWISGLDFLTITHKIDALWFPYWLVSSALWLQDTYAQAVQHLSMMRLDLMILMHPICMLKSLFQTFPNFGMYPIRAQAYLHTPCLWVMWVFTLDHWFSCTFANLIHRSWLNIHSIQKHRSFSVMVNVCFVVKHDLVSNVLQLPLFLESP